MSCWNLSPNTDSKHLLDKYSWMFYRHIEINTFKNKTSDPLLLTRSTHSLPYPNGISIFLDTPAKNFEVILIFLLHFYPTSNPFTNAIVSTTKYFHVQLFPTASLATTLVHLLIILSLELLRPSPTWCFCFFLSPWVMKWNLSIAAKWSFKKRSQTRSVLCSRRQRRFPSHLE